MKSLPVPVMSPDIRWGFWVCCVGHREAKDVISFGVVPDPHPGCSDTALWTTHFVCATSAPSFVAYKLLC